MSNLKYMGWHYDILESVTAINDLFQKNKMKHFYNKQLFLHSSGILVWGSTSVERFILPLWVLQSIWVLDISAHVGDACVKQKYKIKGIFFMLYFPN